MSYVNDSLRCGELTFHVEERLLNNCHHKERLAAVRDEIVAFIHERGRKDE